MAALKSFFHLDLSTSIFGGLRKWWYPQNIHFNRDPGFHYKPSILGYPYFWKHPFRLRQRLRLGQQQYHHSDHSVIIIIWFPVIVPLQTQQKYKITEHPTSAAFVFTCVVTSTSSLGKTSLAVWVLLQVVMG